jgi:hypothetical protein
MTTYAVTATRVGEWWALEATVPQASVRSQTRRLEQVEATAREAIALALDEPPDSFELSVSISVPDDLGARIESATELTRLATDLQALALQAKRSVAAELHMQGYSVRDSGSLLGISSQRVSQLIAEHRHLADSVYPSAEVLVTFDERLHAVVAPLVDGGRVRLSDHAHARASAN